MFAEVYSKPERLEQFMEAMAGISAATSIRSPTSSTSRAITRCATSVVRPVSCAPSSRGNIRT